MNLYLKYLKTISKSWFQYRFDAVLRSSTVFLREAAGIITIYLTLLTFDSIGGWNLYELMFLFSFLFLTYGILVMFCTGLRDFQGIVYSGDLDRFLMRPRSVLFQVVAANADMFAAVGHGGLGVVLLILSANRVNIVWSAVNIFYLFVTVISGVIIQASIFLFVAALSFWVIKTDNLLNAVFYNPRKFAGYPINIFPRWIQDILIFVLPFAFVNYFPVQFFL
ncbi:MAG: ABC-2 family transporter protein, partial [Ruminococcus sp.]|nr:ABC-2 family transporter protein [Ruminococcus sp.]